MCLARTRNTSDSCKLNVPYLRLPLGKAARWLASASKRFKFVCSGVPIMCDVMCTHLAP